MRKMADSVNVADLPAGFDLYGAYVDGLYKNYAQAVARFPGRVVGIAVSASTNDGIVGDCENGDMNPQTAVSWVVMRRKGGVDPTIYCSDAAWAAVQLAFRSAQVPEPHYWIAAYPGNGQQLYAGAVAHQWIDHGPYDESIVADYWPGVDPALQPVHIPKGKTVQSTQVTIGGTAYLVTNIVANGHAVQVRQTVASVGTPSTTANTSIIDLTAAWPAELSGVTA